MGYFYHISCIECTSTRSGIPLTTLSAIDTDCTERCKSNYHTMNHYRKDTQTRIKTVVLLLRNTSLFTPFLVHIYCSPLSLCIFIVHPFPCVYLLFTPFLVYIYCSPLSLCTFIVHPFPCVYVLFTPFLVYIYCSPLSLCTFIVHPFPCVHLPSISPNIALVFSPVKCV